MLYKEYILNSDKNNDLKVDFEAKTIQIKKLKDIVDYGKTFYCSIFLQINMRFIYHKENLTLISQSLRVYILIIMKIMKCIIYLNEIKNL